MMSSGRRSLLACGIKLGSKASWSSESGVSLDVVAGIVSMLDDRECSSTGGRNDRVERGSRFRADVALQITTRSKSVLER